MPDGLYPIAKKLLFKLGAEDAHRLTLAGMRVAQKFGQLAPMFPIPADLHKPVECMGLTFPNAVGLAAGMDKSASTIDAFGAIGFGHIEAGTVTPRPQDGNPKPRLFRLVEEEALINRMGFNNPGVDRFVRNLERVETFAGIVGASIGKNADTPNDEAIDDYVKAFRAVYLHSDYIAINISSPNTKGLRDLQESESSGALIKRLQEERQQLHDASEVNPPDRRPLVVKFSPDLAEDHICGLADLCNRMKIDAVVVANTTLARTGVESHPLHHEKGGLSGKPLATRASEQLKIWRRELADAIPIIAVGGIMTGDDARQRIDEGAALIQ
ncbi:MAG: quinone-dependent dihydroorotate dehydrogenase, partial [Verrucomicrobiota bacterium]